MKLSDYSNLKEVHSLDNMIKLHLDKISEEEHRIVFLTKKRKQKDQELQELLHKKSHLESEISKFEVKLFDLEKRLSTSLEHLSMAQTQKEANALQKEIDTLTPEVDQIQELSLDILESIEDLDKEIIQINGFMAGSLETLEEVKTEVELVRKQEEIPIGQYEERIKLLLEDSPSALVDAFTKVRNKYQYKRPIVRIINHACEFCHFRIDQMSLERVESLQGIEFCGQCGRLFIPLES